MAGSKIIGQTDAKKQMSIDLYKHTSLENNKPTVMLYYGPSGVGNRISQRNSKKI